jgi:hypothetical protein
MALKAKDNSKSVEAKKYTGICAFQVAGMNPDLKQLVAMGITTDKDPVYVGEKDGVSTLRLDIWLKNPVAEIINTDGTTEETEILTKFALFLEDRVVKSKDGSKVQIINDYGQSTWATSCEATPSWMKVAGIREAKVGEVALIEFLYTWMGLAKGYKDKDGDECKLDTKWKDLIAGNVKELQGYVKDALEVGNGIKVLLGVREVEKDGKNLYYQDVYTKYIMRPGQRTFDKLIENLNDQYGEFKSIYTPDLKLRVFSPELIQPDMEKVFAPPATISKEEPQEGDAPF